MAGAGGGGGWVEIPRVFGFFSIVQYLRFDDEKRWEQTMKRPQRERWGGRGLHHVTAAT